MPNRVELHLLAVGACRHCERVALRSGRWRSITFPSICALIIHPTQGAWLYDTGYAEHFMAATQPFPERLYRWVTPVHLPAHECLSAQLAQHGLSLADIRGCVISHFHADHIAGLRDLPKARFIALRADVNALRQSRIGNLLDGFLPALLPPDFAERLDYADDQPRVPLGAAWAQLGAGFDLLGDGSLLAVPLPGHSAGHMGLRFIDQHAREILLCADACWSRTAWQTLSYPSLITRPVMHDWQQYKTTLQHLHQLGTQHPELWVLPSHCSSSLAAYHSGLARA